MSDPMMIAPGWLIPAGAGGIALLKAYDWWMSRRSTGAAENASASLITGLTARIIALEKSQVELEKKVEEANKSRHEAEEEAHNLRLRIDGLEYAMRQANVPVPERR